MILISGSYIPGTAERIEARVVKFDHLEQAVTKWSSLKLLSREKQFEGGLQVPQGGWYRTQIRAVDGEEKIIDTILGDHKWGVGMLILCIGQSNMNGQGQPPYTRAGGMVVNFNRKNQWEHLKDPYAGEGASVVPALGNLLTTKLKIPVAFIPAAVSGAGLYEDVDYGYWLDRNAQNYKDCTTTYGNAVARAEAAGGAELILWNQGETDGKHLITKKQYKEGMERLLEELRSDLKNPSLPMFLA